MPSLLYIHGFLSSPASHKAVQLRQWLASNRPEVAFICPALPPYPAQAARLLEQALANAPGPVGLIGSSLGGFWATWLAETRNLRALLINPSVDPMTMLPAYFERPVQSFHSDEVYTLTPQHLTELRRFHQPVISRPQNYWLLAQTGDETLDYRLAAAKYRDCRQTIEQGGDHGFQGFERFFAQGVAFVLDE